MFFCPRTFKERMVKKSNKKVKKLAIVWGVGAIVLFFVPGMIFTRMILKGVSGDYIKQAEIAETLDKYDELNLAEGDKKLIYAVASRSALSPFTVGETELIASENDNIFVKKNGNFEYSEGSYLVVARKVPETGTVSYLKTGFALVNLNKANEDGYVEKLNAYYTNDSEVSFRLDKYAKKGYTVVPMTISVYDRLNNCVEIIDCNPKESIEGYAVVEDDNAYLSLENAGSVFDGFFKDTEDSHKAALDAAQTVNFSQPEGKIKTTILPWKGTRVRVVVKGDYALVASNVVHTKAFLVVVGSGLCIVYSIIMGIVSLVVALTSKGTD